MHGGRKRVEGGERGRMKSLWSEKSMTQGKRERKKNSKRWLGALTWLWGGRIRHSNEKI